MSDFTEDLDAEEAQILAQLKAVREKKELKLRAELERKRLEALTKPISIAVSFTTDNNKLILKLSESRDDILALLRSIRGRLYNSTTQTNAIPIVEWAGLEPRLRELKNITFNFPENFEERFKKILFSANFEVSLVGKYLAVAVNSRAERIYDLQRIPGVFYDYTKHEAWMVPLTEGWRLYEFCTELSQDQTVTWTKEASEFVAKQIEQRMMLDKIALAKDWDITIPGFNGTLKPFQKVGTAFFTLNGGSGILGDEMGLGKSAQALALALWIAAQIDNGAKILLVVPASLKINWIREIQKFTSEKSYTLSGTTPTAYDVATIWSRDCPRFVIINYDILGSNFDHDESYKDDNGIFHEKITKKFPWVEILNRAEFDMVVYDEGHYIKNRDSNRSRASRQLKAKRTLFLTGTPVLNRPGELWPMLHIIDEKLFPSHEKFIQQYTVDGKVTRNVNELREALKPVMIRRLKKDVYDELPPLNRIEEAYELSPRARKLYEKALNDVYTVMEMWNPAEAGNEKKISNILVKIQRLKQIAAIDKVPATADLATRIFDSSDPSERPKKVLIFSQFKPTAYAIKTRLGREAIGFVSRNAQGEFVTAQAAEQDRLVQEFQNNPDIHYLVVTEKTAKEGHNITQAMAVIFNDLFWTPAGHQQAEGRAYMRNNDPHGIDSYYHIAVESIDEWIQGLLQAKLKIIEETVDGVQSSRVAADESIVKELIAKIKEGMWKR